MKKLFMAIMIFAMATMAMASTTKVINAPKVDSGSYLELNDFKSYNRFSNNITSTITIKHDVADDNGVLKVDGVEHEGVYAYTVNLKAMHPSNTVIIDGVPHKLGKRIGHAFNSNKYTVTKEIYHAIRNADTVYLENINKTLIHHRDIKTKKTLILTN